MTRTNPPRLAVALLGRFLPHDDALAGDLLERYAATGSRLWLWREVLMAILLRGFMPRDREHRSVSPSHQACRRKSTRGLWIHSQSTASRLVQRQASADWA
jgi:hypothetical protein